MPLRNLSLPLSSGKLDCFSGLPEQLQLTAAEHNPPVVLSLCHWSHFKIVLLIYPLVESKNTSQSCFSKLTPSAIRHWLATSKMKHGKWVFSCTLLLKTYLHTLWLLLLFNWGREIYLYCCMFLKISVYYYFPLFILRFSIHIIVLCFDVALWDV